ncbi:hypothetical protein AA0112_g7390 [Alternaria arborescens]|nr:hypothetical protein AA0112_g7390 [Alternaria arborescens]
MSFSRTFQEYLLSPRTLLLGHKNLMYQCTQLFYDELLGPLGTSHNPVLTTIAASEKPNLNTDLRKSKYFPSTLPAVGKKSSEDSCAPVITSFLRTWLSLINEYRARRLSFGEDRIIAMAGIARAFAHLGDMTYLAGMWRQCLPVGLLWYVAEKPSLLARAHNNIAPGPPVSYTVQVIEEVALADGKQQVPSWSFFSIPIFAFHHMGLLFGDEEVSVRRKSMADSARVCFDSVFWATVLAFWWKDCPEGQVPVRAYNDFTGLRITLETKMLPVSSGWLTDILEQMQRTWEETTCAADRNLDCSPIFNHHPDDIRNSNGELPENTVLALVVDVQIVRPAGRYTVQRCLMGLVLLPGVERDTWTRVGVWKLRLKITGVEVTSENMGLVAERWRVYDVLSKRWTKKVVTLV